MIRDSDDSDFLDNNNGQSMMLNSQIIRYEKSEISSQNVSSHREK